MLSPEINWHLPRLASPLLPSLHSWEGGFLIFVKFYECFAFSVNKGLISLKGCDGAHSGLLLWLQKHTPTVRCFHGNEKKSTTKEVRKVQVYLRFTGFCAILSCYSFTHNELMQNSNTFALWFYLCRKQS